MVPGAQTAESFNTRLGKGFTVSMPEVSSQMLGAIPNE